MFTAAVVCAIIATIAGFAAIFSAVSVLKLTLLSTHSLDYEPVSLICLIPVGSCR